MEILQDTTRAAELEELAALILAGNGLTKPEDQSATALAIAQGKLIVNFALGTENQRVSA